MKVRLEMELHDVLRIALLLDHHRLESAEAADVSVEPVATLYKTWGNDAGQLRQKLLEAIGRAGG